MSEITPSIKEGQLDKHFGIPLSKWNSVQIELMSRSGLDHEDWNEKYSPLFQKLIEVNPDLVVLIKEHEPKAIVEEVERRLEEMV